MRPHSLLLGLSALLLCASSSAAQRSYGGLAPSRWHAFDLAPPTSWMGPVDEQALLAEDAQAPKGALRYGALLPSGASHESAGRWDVLPGGDLVWRLHISSPGARSIGLLFDRFRLPSGAQLFVHDGADGAVLGAYTELNNKANGQFQIEPLRGDSATLELLVPARSPEMGELRISDVIHDYRGITEIAKSSGGGGPDGNCETNVNCPVGDPWEDQINATTRLLSGGALCTGSLLNNTANDGTQYYITASHCGNLGNAVFLFNYQTANCNGGGTAGSGSVQGSVNLASSSSIDYRLVRITENIPASFDAYYAGWDRTGSFPSSTVTVHHPGGGVKKISFDNDSPQKSGQDWRIVQWDLGVTEPGSSGCPLYDSNGRFIGQLWGGAAACGYPFDDYYGRFQLAWNQVSQYLDPIGSGAAVIDGLGDGTPPPPPPAECSVTVIGEGAGGANIGTLSTPNDAQIGTTVSLEVRGLNGDSSGTVILSGSSQNISLAGGTVFVNYLSPFASLPISIVGGSGSINVSIPNSTSLVGKHGYIQMGTQDASQSSGWAFTNALDLAFCN